MEKDTSNQPSPAPRLSSPWLAVIVFLFIIIFVPFYESKRIVIWETQRDEKGSDVFRGVVLNYALQVEVIKAALGLKDFFEKEHLALLRLKKSPLLFQEESVKSVPAGTNDAGQDFEEASEAIKASIGSVVSEPPEEPAEELTEEPAKEPMVENNSQLGEEAIQATTAENPEQAPADDEIVVEKANPPFRILIMGDSFVVIGGGLGDPLERALLGYKDVVVDRLGRTSSGLAKPEYFNWELTAEEAIRNYQPNIAVVMLGSNDAQSLVDSSGAVIKYGMEGWDQEYTSRVISFLDILEKNNVMTFWIGLPIMRSPTFSPKMNHLSALYEGIIKQQKNVYFISIWNLLADKDGDYTAYLPDDNGLYKLARLTDGIHFQYFAGEIVAGETIRKMEEKINLEKK